MNHIKFNKEKLIKQINNYPPYDINAINKFFENNEVISLLENNRFDELYEYFNKTTLSDNSTLTAILMLSGIDFLNHIFELPKECFYGISIDKLYLPATIEKYAEESLLNEYKTIKEINFELTFDKLCKACDFEFCIDFDKSYLYTYLGLSDETKINYGVKRV